MAQMKKHKLYYFYHIISIDIGRRFPNQKEKKILLHYNKVKVKGFTIAAFHNCSHETLMFHELTHKHINPELSYTTLLEQKTMLKNLTYIYHYCTNGF